MLLLLLLGPGRSCVLDGGCDDTDCDKEDEVDDFTESGALQNKRKKQTFITCSIKVQVSKRHPYVLSSIASGVTNHYSCKCTQWKTFSLFITHTDEHLLYATQRVLSGKHAAYNNIEHFSESHFSADTAAQGLRL